MNQLIGTTNIQNNAIDAVDKLYKYSEILASSSIIPAHYRGKTSDVFVAVQTAYRMNQDPMMVMQGTYIIKGKLSMYTSFAISLANSSGILQDGIRYKIEGSGDDLKVTAFSNLKASGAEISYTIGMKEARSEGWTSNAKYKSLPELMLRYRAATLLIRTHIPEVLNGMHTVEELKDVEASKSVQVVNASSSEERKVNVVDDFLLEEDNAEAVIGNKVVEGELLVSSSHAELQSLIKTYNVPNELVEKWCEKGEVATIEELDEAKRQACINYVLENYVNSDKETVIKNN